jgi:hypothetical protein
VLSVTPGKAGIRGEDGAGRGAFCGQRLKNTGERPPAHINGRLTAVLQNVLFGTLKYRNFYNRRENMSEKSIRSIGEYVEEIYTGCGRQLTGKYIFRGQADYDWNTASSAGRRLAEEKKCRQNEFIRADGLIPRPLGRMKGIKSRLRYL